ncbi:CCHC-type domain-containing protein [Aphis craccivora]|uniref:CCHC-type domain-containing protein n=1 Tax=Aphis craccivora TaxID=307492 RepID=A0A6G0W6D7_APHCR|nr:CCHC-type domain-containing protein [Aphis craccivora]
MSNPGASDSDNSDLIDLSSPSSDTSSGELYIPRKVLNRERDYLDPTGEIVGTPRASSRNRASFQTRASIQPEHRINPEHPQNPQQQQNLKSIEQSIAILNQVRVTLDKVNITITETTRILQTDKKPTSNKEVVMAKHMSIEQALKLIPVFDGENSDSNHAFQNSCDFALQNIDPSENDNFVKGITTRLTGKAYRAIRYKEIKKYEDLKIVLNSLVDKKFTLAHLHSKLSMFRLAYGETIQQYADRAEQLFYEIMEASISTGGLDNPEGISKITAMQILTAFTEGLPHDTRIIVKARKPSDLNEAVQIAIEEETSRLSQKEMRKNNNHQKVDNKHKSNQNHPASSHSKSMGACFLCGRTNHQAHQCHASEADKIRYKESNQKGKTQQRDVKTITCRYCKKPNHTLEECRKRKYVNEKKEQEKQASASGNESTPGPSGGRPVGQIKTATLNLQGFSFSKQN